MTARVIVTKLGREYLCWEEAGDRWRCGCCRRGFLRRLRSDPDRGACSVCHAELVAVEPGERVPPVPIPPRGEVRTRLDVYTARQGWDVVCAVRALHGEYPVGSPLTKAAAAIFAWQALSVAIRQGGNDLNAMVARLDAAAAPEENRE